jgi:hypothetical protein
MPDRAAVYEEVPVRRLPGLLRKRVYLSPQEVGLLLEGGEVKELLPPGSHVVGWRFLGLGSGGRTVARLRADPFSLPLRFYRLGEDAREPLDAFTQATVVVVDPHAFHRFASEGRRSLTAPQLGNAVAARVQVILDQLAARFEPSALKADPVAGERLTALVAPLLEDHLRERGLRLEKVYPLVFRPSRETEAILEEALTLQADLLSADRRDWVALRQKVERFASLALEVELASSSEVEALKAAVGTVTQDALDNVLALVNETIARLGGRVAERAQRLPTAGRPAGRPGPSRPSPLRRAVAWLEGALSALLLGVLVAAIPAYFLWFRAHGLGWGAYLGGVAILVGLVRLALIGLDGIARRGERRRAEEEAGEAWFQRWLTQDAARVDELLRQQVAAELEGNVLPDLREAARLLHGQGRREEAQHLRGVAEEVRELALRIRGAEYGRSALPPGRGAALRLGARLVAFEEESLRLARLLAARSGELKGRLLEGSGPDLHSDLRKVREVVEALKGHFARRAALLAGMPMEAKGSKGGNGREEGGVR